VKKNMDASTVAAVVRAGITDLKKGRHRLRCAAKYTMPRMG